MCEILPKCIYTVEKNLGNMFLKRMPCSTKQYRTPRHITTEPFFFTVEVSKRTSMGFAFIFRTRTEMSKYGRKQIDNSPPGWICISVKELQYGVCPPPAFITAWHLRGMLRISRLRSRCGIRFHDLIRACSSVTSA